MITIVMAYYENGGMLDRHIEEWKNYPDALKDQIKAVIVDDGSSKDSALPHVQDVGFPIELYRINVDIPWNQNGARNLAMTHTDVVKGASRMFVQHEVAYRILLPAHEG